MIMWLLKDHISSPKTKEGRKKRKQHLCLDKAYNSKSVKQEIIKRGYVPHIRYKRKRGDEVKTENTETCTTKNDILQKDGGL